MVTVRPADAGKNSIGWYLISESTKAVIARRPTFAF